MEMHCLKRQCEALNSLQNACMVSFGDDPWIAIPLNNSAGWLEWWHFLYNLQAIWRLLLIPEQSESTSFPFHVDICGRVVCWSNHSLRYMRRYMYSRSLKETFYTCTHIKPLRSWFYNIALIGNGTHTYLLTCRNIRIDNLKFPSTVGGGGHLHNPNALEEWQTVSMFNKHELNCHLQLFIFYCTLHVTFSK